MEFVIGLLFLCIALMSFIRTKRIEAPQVLVSGVWAGFLILYAIVNPDYFPLGSRFYIAIILWVVFFYIGAIVGQLITRHSVCNNIPDKYIIRLYFIITPVFAITTSYLCIKQALGSSNMFLYLRMMNTGLDDTILPLNLGWLVYLTSLVLVLFLLELASYGIKRKRIVLLLLFLNLLIGFVTMAKSVIFITMVSALIILLARKEVSYKNVFICFVAFLAVSVIMQTLRSESGDIDISFLSNYIFPSAVAFNYADIDDSLPWGAYVFRLFYAIGHRMGLIAQAPVDVIMPYTSIADDNMTNVYTVLYPFYHDFGLAGVVIFAIILGSVGGFFYKKSENSIPAKVFYAIFGSTILFQFTGEIFLTNASLYIQYLFYAYLPFKLKLTHG